jgi:SAM-dependent methyltransferase
MQTTIPCEREVGNWGPYFDATCQRDCSALLIESLRHVDERGLAVDLGAGAMNDSIRMLHHGFRKVTAVDAATDSKPYADKVRAAFGPRFEFCNGRFCDFPFETESSDLVHANFSLPFHGDAGFDELIRTALESVKVKGVFSAIFFGYEDEWTRTKPDLAFRSKEQIEQMLSGFELAVPLREFKRDSGVIDAKAPSGRRTKFWHYFQVVARRVSPVL